VLLFVYFVYIFVYFSLSDHSMNNLFFRFIYIVYRSDPVHIFLHPVEPCLSPAVVLSPPFFHVCAFYYSADETVFWFFSYVHTTTI